MAGEGVRAGGRAWQWCRGARVALCALLGGMLVLAATSRAMAQEIALDTGNTAWMLTASALVLLMTLPGLALFYGGLVRTKNVLSMAMQCSPSPASSPWSGWRRLQPRVLAARARYVGDLRDCSSRGMAIDSLKRHHPGDRVRDVPDDVRDHHAGADHRRLRRAHEVLGAALFMGLWGLLVYAPIAHWVWGAGGWSCSWACSTSPAARSCTSTPASPAWSRRWCSASAGYGVETMAPHNLTLTVIGAALLWVGWFGFNAGSALAADGAAGMAMPVTQIAAAAAALAWMLVGVAAARQAERARHRVRRGCGPGHDHAGLRLRRPERRARHRHRGRRRLLLAPTSLKRALGSTTRSTRSASTASAASSARS